MFRRLTLYHAAILRTAAVRLDRFVVRRYNMTMARRVEFFCCQPKTILNKGKHPDHWFWSRYSACPYKSCQHRCLFRYCRERKYCHLEDMDDFGYVIQAKENAPDLLRRALSRMPVELVATGDYQPAERRFGLSRKMLETCLGGGSPGEGAC